MMHEHSQYISNGEMTALEGRKVESNIKRTHLTTTAPNYDTVPNYSIELPYLVRCSSLLQQ